MNLKIKFIALLAIAASSELSGIIYPPNTSNLPASNQTDKVSITQSYISNGNTYTISAPGSYYLASNLAFTPTASDSTAILINASNVNLDLGTKAIYCTNKTQTGTVAIEVATGLSNINIYNGSINTMTNNGVLVNSDCSNIQVANISMSDCDGGGIAIDGSNHIYLINCTITNCNASTSFGETAAVRITDSSHVYCDSSEFSNSNGTYNSNTLSAYGVFVQGTSSGCFFRDCTSRNNRGYNAAYGFYVENSNSFDFQDCDSSAHIGTNGISCGYCLTSCSAINFLNCTANSNSSPSFYSYGYYVDAASSTASFANCQAQSNQGNIFCVGFNLLGSANCLDNCVANQNNCSGAEGTVGFYLNGSSAGSNTLRNCVANQNKSSGGNVCGFRLLNCWGNRLTNCIANGNTTTAANNYAAGFASSAGSCNVFENCVGNNQLCTGTGTGNGTSSTLTQYAAGFLLTTGENSTTLTNCQANNNNGGPGYGVGFGIYLRGAGYLTDTNDTTAPTNTVVTNCTMQFNTSTGGGETQSNKYGFFDESENTTSVLINNVSMGHGRCLLSLNTSFDFVDPITNGGTPGMNYMFHHTGVDENPTNIIHETDNSNWTTLSSSVPNWMNVSIAVGQVTTGSAGT